MARGSLSWYLTIDIARGIIYIFIHFANSVAESNKNLHIYLPYSIEITHGKIAIWIPYLADKVDRLVAFLHHVHLIKVNTIWSIGKITGIHKYI